MSKIGLRKGLDGGSSFLTGIAVWIQKTEDPLDAVAPAVMVAVSPSPGRSTSFLERTVSNFGTPPGKKGTRKRRKDRPSIQSR